MHNHSRGQKLFFVIIFNLIITIVEIVGGIFSKSLALLSDAFHNFTDTIALILSYIAVKLGEKSPDNKRTFGYKRAEIVAAFINAIFIFFIILYILYESFKRFKNPQAIKFSIMFYVAIVGLLGNLFSIIFLKKEIHGSLNLKSAFLHLLSDFISSIIVVIGAIIIKLFNIPILDPILTLIIILFIIKETIKIFTKSVNILLEGAPKNINIEELIGKLKDISPYINNVHHLHIWSIDEKNYVLECHIKINEDISLKKLDSIRENISNLLANNYGIKHINIQFEHGGCLDEGIIHKKESH